MAHTSGHIPQGHCVNGAAVSLVTRFGKRAVKTILKMERVASGGIFHSRNDNIRIEQC